MCHPSITQFPLPDHNVPEDDEPIPAICPCLRCGGRSLGWDEPVLLCPTCGTEWELTQPQADEFTLAVLGLNGLRLDLFLAAIDREGGGAPSPFLYPALQPTWHVLGTFPSRVLAEVA